MAAIVFTASTGYAPVAVSADSITASVPSSTALATSLTSARVGCGETIMLSSIWVATIARGDLGVEMPLDGRLLDQRHALERHLHAQVPAGDHHPFGKLRDLVDPIDGLRLLQLGDHGRGGRVSLDQPDVVGVAHEAHGHVVDLVLETELEVMSFVRNADDIRLKEIRAHHARDRQA